MATTEEITALQGKLGPWGAQYTTTELGTMIDASDTGDLNVIASELWGTFAAQSSTMVDVSESGSSRAMGDVYKNAIAMSKFYADQASSPTDATAGRPRTRRIERV